MTSLAAREQHRGDDSRNAQEETLHKSLTLSVHVMPNTDPSAIGT